MRTAEEGGAPGRRWLPGVLCAFALLALLGWMIAELRGQQAELEGLRRQVRALSPRAGAAPDPDWQASAGPGQATRAEARLGLGASPSRPAAPAVSAESRSGARAVAELAPAQVRGGTIGEVLGRPSAPPALREAVAEVLASDDPALAARLREVVRAQVDARRDEVREARQARWEERTLSALSEMGTELGLDRSQQDAVFAVLARNRDRTGEAFRTARQDHSFGEARKLAATHRQEADAEARALLDDDQYDGYLKLRAKERERRGYGPRKPSKPAPAKDATGETK